MKTKYYTPSKEEFHISLECENQIIRNGKEVWLKRVITEKDFRDESYENVFKFQYRIKYLDELDLIQLGWEFDETNGGYETNDNNILILRYFVEGRGWYLTYDENESQFGFGGYVKNKSEMKKLMEMLNIKL